MEKKKASNSKWRFVWMSKVHQLHSNFPSSAEEEDGEGSGPSSWGATYSEGPPPALLLISSSFSPSRPPK